MKRKLFFAARFGVALALGLVLLGCPGEDDGGNVSSSVTTVLVYNFTDKAIELTAKKTDDNGIIVASINNKVVQPYEAFTGDAQTGSYRVEIIPRPGDSSVQMPTPLVVIVGSNEYMYSGGTSFEKVTNNLPPPIAGADASSRLTITNSSTSTTIAIVRIVLDSTSKTSFKPILANGGVSEPWELVTGTSYSVFICTLENKIPTLTTVKIIMLESTGRIAWNGVTLTADDKGVEVEKTSSSEYEYPYDEYPEYEYPYDEYPEYEYPYDE
jgi:hypothetical protein